jgi:hypothetical protein
MTEVLLASCSGGIVNQALIEDLRGDKVAGDAKLLAEIAEFTDLGGTAPKRAEYDADFETAFQVGKAIWAGMADELAVGIDTGRLRDRLLLPLLRHLGFDPQFQRAHLPAAGDTYRISHLGWDAADAPPFIIEPGEPDVGTGGRRAAHDEMQRYLNGSAVAWGIVTNGTVLRLLRNFHHTRTKGYVQFDLAAIFTAGSVDDFRAMWRTCHASRFQSRADPDTGDPAPASHPHAHCLLEQLHQKSLTAGVTAGNRLKPQIRRAIEELANGALHQNPELLRRLNDEAEFGRALYGELLTVLYRVLFLLFAEQRDMLRSANSLYDETYSLTRLRQQAEERRYEGRRHDLWEGLKATFAAFHNPTLAHALGVYPYNGELFDSARTPHLNAARIPNRNVARAVRSLTTVEVGKVSLHVDYRHLGVEELGAVYESLLDYTLRVADQPVAVEGRRIAVGQAYLSPFSTERGDLASYYTPPALVSLVLDRSLDPLIADRLAGAGTEPSAREAALLDLRIIDPACGSAAYLVGAVDRVGLAVARERHHPVEPSDVQVASARRDALSHCIYGADKDSFAVELAKVALWIHCAIADTPLSFLDHHIVCGDSLVGWPMIGIPFDIDQGVFAFAKANKDDEKGFAEARRRNASYLEDLKVHGLLFGPPDPAKSVRDVTLPSRLDQADESFTDVRAKAEAYDRYLRSDEYQRAKTAADIWTAASFWTADDGPIPTSAEYHAALNGEAGVDLAVASERALAVLTPLHWPLAFPDIRERGGFDLVIGNPPWEQYKGQEQEFFAEHKPYIADLAGGERKQAIADLADTDPVLFDRWQRYRASSERLAHFAKSSGRFRRTSTEANTYVLFAEMGMNLVDARPGARLGLVLKAGICLDESQAPVWAPAVQEGRVIEIREGLNRGPGSPSRVFPGVKDPERFCVMVAGPPESTQGIDVSTLSYSLDEMRERPTRHWALGEVATVSPNSFGLLSERSDDLIDLALMLYRCHASLTSKEWGSLGYHRVSDPGAARWAPHALRVEALAAQGWVRQPDGTARRGGEVALPVIEGQMTTAFNHRYKSFASLPAEQKYSKKPALPPATFEQLADPDYEPEPRYWISARELDETLAAVFPPARAAVAIRKVAGAIWSNSRSMRAALACPGPASDGAPLLSVDVNHVFHLLAVLNSTTYDVLIRQRMSGGNHTKWMVMGVPAPPPSAVPQPIADIVERLSVTSKRLARRYGRPLHPFGAPEERSKLMAEVDAAVARAYRLERSDYEAVLDGFSHLRNSEVKLVGQYRTKRLCLEAWGRAETEGTA